MLRRGFSRNTQNLVFNQIFSKDYDLQFRFAKPDLKHCDSAISFCHKATAYICIIIIIT